MIDLFAWSWVGRDKLISFYIARFKKGEATSYDIIPCWGHAPGMYIPTNYGATCCEATEENLIKLAPDLNLTPFQIAAIRKAMRGLGAPVSR